ncbi:di-heme oxidoredictase family protein [Bacteroides sp. GD17]|jgi:CxxC motif-containing protein (DUF1111 family)|uniref:di-heme oxidoredictase family protein n=1 Tax=Bacteroides sp. GD17 TaxID=3139826 RepID=UPI0025F4A805|nr:di-heme oxidoredictase family protein [uncultured Bacteroides sp.]
MYLKKYSFYVAALLSASFFLTACEDDKVDDNSGGGTTTELPDWYYTGGELGTAFVTTQTAFEQSTPVVDADAMMTASFNRGEQFFEKPFNSNVSGTRHGLGPVYVRNSCIHCHPGYGHGKSQAAGSFNTTQIGNGYLLVVYNPATDGYVPWLAGMPQSKAIEPFKAPLDESQIMLSWHDYTDGFGNKFPDGETYQLRYPEVEIPKSAIYIANKGYDIGDYAVRLESTIGIYGTGLLDAISDEDLKAEYIQKEKDGYMTLNPSIFANGDWVKQYSNTAQGGDGTLYPLRYTYALSRGPLQDAAGANAFWNITNATRSDRTFHYLDGAGTYATYSSKDPDVQAAFPAYIATISTPEEHPEWFTDNVESNIYNYLTSKNLPVEVSDQNYIDLMVWHRGLAVPAARNVDDEEVLRGKELFSELGCTYCHKPSWTTGDDEIRDPARFFVGDKADLLPRYPHQKIWPYTDMIQHRLHMVNDIRTGWCRTTPLWGRGLHQRCTGAEYIDRLHDCRARTTLEAIMWHGTSEESDAYRTVVKFRELSKADRDAVVKFLDSI